MSGERRSTGRLFHTAGPLIENIFLVLSGSKNVALVVTKTIFIVLSLSYGTAIICEGSLGLSEGKLVSARWPQTQAVAQDVFGTEARSVGPKHSLSPLTFSL